ncbi:MAG: Rieske 2Fe-2S domain-containing protein [Gemmatimonadota bacterium]
MATMGAGALLACASGSPSGPSLTAFTVTLASYPELATVGGIAVVNNGSQGGHPIAVARTGDVTFVALSLVCPHRGVTVSVVANGFYCTGHGARFASNGNWTGGQQTSGLAHYAVSYDPTAGTLLVS